MCLGIIYIYNASWFTPTAQGCPGTGLHVFDQGGEREERAWRCCERLKDEVLSSIKGDLTKEIIKKKTRKKCNTFPLLFGCTYFFTVTYGSKPNNLIVLNC